MSNSLVAKHRFSFDCLAAASLMPLVPPALRMWRIVLRRVRAPSPPLPLGLGLLSPPLVSLEPAWPPFAWPPGGVATLALPGKPISASAWLRTPMLAVLRESSRWIVTSPISANARHLTPSRDPKQNNLDFPLISLSSTWLWRRSPATPRDSSSLAATRPGTFLDRRSRSICGRPPRRNTARRTSSLGARACPHGRARRWSRREGQTNAASF